MTFGNMSSRQVKMSLLLMIKATIIELLDVELIDIRHRTAVLKLLSYPNMFGRAAHRCTGGALLYACMACPCLFHLGHL
jgi:hypothetical protein